MCDWIGGPLRFAQLTVQVMVLRSSLMVALKLPVAVVFFGATSWKPVNRARRRMTSSSSARTVAEANPKTQSPATSSFTPRFFIARPPLCVSGCGYRRQVADESSGRKRPPNSDTYALFTHNLLFPKGRVPFPSPFALKTLKRSALHVVGRRDAGDGFGNSRLSLLPRTENSELKGGGYKLSPI